MFAGPNGSGKSTLIRKLQSLVLRPGLLGVYINADDIEELIRKNRQLDLTAWGITGAADDILPFLTESPFLKSAGLAEAAKQLTLSRENLLHFAKVPVNAYYASVIADFLRRRLLEQRNDFTFETVMSSPDKISFLKEAQDRGYRTYLYYVATEDPIINISRVHNRVALGGHPVPEDKIIKRYHGSLGLLRAAIRNSHRAYIFDNSGNEQDHTWLAEITDGKTVEIKTDRVPEWFAKVLMPAAS